MKFSGIDRLCILLCLAAPSAIAEQPTCRWLHLDDAKVYQCIVLSPESQVVKQQTDGLPDPTMPLAEQEYSAPIKLQESPMPVQQTVQTSSRYIVLGLGDIESNKARMLAEDDTEFAFLPAPNKLSLGVFGSESNALRRKQTVESLGVESEVLAFPLTQRPTIPSLMQEPSAYREPSAFREPSAHKEPSAYKEPSVVRDSSSSNSAVIPKAVPAETKVANAFIQLPIAHRESQTGMLLKVSGVPNETTLLRGVERQLVEAAKTKSGPSGYIVASIGDTESVLSRLESIKAQDYVLMKRGPYKDRVSVGVFGSLDNALARQNRFKAHGIDSEVVLRSDESVVRSSEPVELKSHHFEQIALTPLGI